ncbi:hypothetical protein VNI00_006843 [Paramarasmius palmivorus]|uniref:Uncharacterized protein n=1 Tax=Paramarasmius palmivorus TaxID=297713 RepID=A0AAW0D879_9AGAR
MTDTSKQSDMEKAAVQRAGEISVRIREAIRKALPTPAEQFFTVMIPGKDYEVPEDANELLPTRIELAQARLCDDMPALGPVQLGPTGRSVARSYATAISKLIPAGTTIGIDEGSNGVLSEDQKRYKQAMTILSSEVPGKDGHTLVELYTAKQKAYTAAVSAKTRAFDEAMKIAQNDPANNTPTKIRAAYDRWVQENARAYRNSVQAAYMDWVIMGKKEEVEYWFSIVDQDSALARVEQSKETMRWAVVQDSDGSGEYQKVFLEPRDWANKCQKKAASGSNQTRTIEWYSWEITRLEKQNQMLSVFKESAKSRGEKKVEKVEEGPAKTALDDAMKEAIAAEQDLRSTPAVSLQKQLRRTNGTQKKVQGKPLLHRHTTAQGNLKTARENFDKVKLDNLCLGSKEAQNNMFKEMADDDKGMINSQIVANNKLIVDYVDARKLLLDNQAKGAEGNAVIQQLSNDMGIPRALPDPAADRTKKSDEDFFTPISLEISSSSETKEDKQSASSLSFNAAASYNAGFWSASASVSHSQSKAHAEAMSELANASVKVSFECMRVDINRPWLRGELFYDEDLVLGPATPALSPGFEVLGNLLETNKCDQYPLFPMYPTGFLVGCNVVLEISGSTSKLQTMFNTSSSSTAASLSVNYGPFSCSASGSYSKSSTESSSKCEATASGCRITVKSPQIIGWISQMVPPLPRPEKKAPSPEYKA